MQWEYSKPFKAAYLVALHIHEHQTIVSYLIGKVNVIHCYCMQIIPSIGAPQRDLVYPKKPRKCYKSIKHSVKQLYLSKNKIKKKNGRRRSCYLWLHYWLPVLHSTGGPICKDITDIAERQNWCCIKRVFWFRYLLCCHASLSFPQINKYIN